MTAINIEQPLSQSKNVFWLTVIVFLVVIISALHYTTSTHHWQYHLVFMQAYFIPIIIAAFQYGIRGGLGTGIIVSIIYFPHIMLQWGGLVETNLMRFLQIILFNVIGYITGLKAEREKEETQRYQQAAQELRASLQQLNAQAEKLSELEEQLRQNDRMAVVGELTASMAHEVRNPLGSIRGAVEIIRDEAPEPLKKNEFFAILIKETERLNAVLEKYLGFARRKTQTITDYDVREVVNDLIALLNAQAERNQIRLVAEISGLAQILSGDPDHLWQILMNLVLNSIQSMESGGKINLTVVSAADGTKPQYISVRDDGPGISKTERNKIFQAFYTTRVTGTGLGLAIVKRLVEANRWRIDVDSEIGKGTEFRIYFGND